MPPIPVHIDAPISPSRTKAAPPQAALAASDQATSSDPTSAQAYPAARPGAPAAPGPTPYLSRPQPAPTRTTDPSSAPHDLPPAPQPGAVPQPPTQPAPSTLPPPPHASLPSPAVPHQLHIPPPQQNLAPTATTDPTPRGRPGPGPTTLDLGPVSGAAPAPALHPPGYRQDAYAQELSPAARASLDEQQASEKRTSGIFGGLGDLPGSGGVGGGGALDGGAGAEEVWRKVKGWGSVAGEKAAEVHGEVWKWIDGSAK